jgi:hypothetical protein
VSQILCEVDHGHPAAAELLLDAIPVGKHCGESSYGIRHAGKMGWRGGVRQSGSSADCALDPDPSKL